jgi:hypothetical protein
MGVIMKISALFAALLAALFLTACGEKVAEAPAPEAAPAAEAAPAVPAPEPAAAAGGYTPTAEELVPGITRTKEEQDKINAEAMTGTPMPAIPGEAPPAAAEAAPVVAPPAAPEAAK